ncbi:MAG: hypothetical protein IKN06_10975 [Bacteroidales bacterium]|nr:hypothetical protein [Bacteroidales bacterium]
MKTKIVYVLTIGDNGFRFYEMLLLSIRSLKLHNSNVQIEVVLDRESASVLREKNLALPGDVKQTLVDIPPEWAKYKSRFLKTKLRFLVGGDFLYLDVDTLIAGNLEQIDNETATLAAVSDGNGPLNLLNDNDAELCHRAGIPSPMGVPYFNSGVMFVKDTPSSDLFYEQWHSLWKSMALKGIARDQMSLLAANEKLGYPICELSGEWNCQLYYSSAIHYYRNAKILHYYLCGFIERFVLNHVKNGIMDDCALSVAAEPLKNGFRFYNPKHILFVRPWSHVLYLFRKNPRAYLFLKSLTGNLAAVFQ